jgi:hypothetical protein
MYNKRFPKTLQNCLSSQTVGELLSLEVSIKYVDGMVHSIFALYRFHLFGELYSYVCIY